MFQLRTEHENIITKLDEKLNQSNQMKHDMDENMNKNVSQHSATIVDLNEEKDVIMVKVALLEKELENSRTNMIDREQTMTTINRQLSTDLERTQRLFDHKVAFDDTRVATFNNLNCPGFDRIFMMRKIEIGESFLTLFAAVNRAYAAHDIAMKDRLTLMGRNLSAVSKLGKVNEKMIELVPEHVNHLNSLFEACQGALMTMKATLDVNVQQKMSQGDQQNVFANVNKCFKGLVLYNNKMLPYELLSLIEEARKDTCVPVLQARNYVLISTRKRFVAALEKLAVYVRLSLDTETHTRTQEANQVAILNNANANVASVYQAFQAYTSHLISKISQEHRASFVLPELKTANEKVLNSLSTLTATAGKMVELMSGYTNSVSSAGGPSTIRGVECDPLQMSEDLGRMQKRARHFFGQVMINAKKTTKEPTESAAESNAASYSNHQDSHPQPRSQRGSPQGSPGSIASGHSPHDRLADDHLLLAPYK